MAVSKDDDSWTLRAELEARKDDIATLRGVVAALRDTLAAKRTHRVGGEVQRIAIQVLATALGVGALLGFGLALAVLQWLRG